MSIAGTCHALHAGLDRENHPVTDAFFIQDTNEWFLPTDHTRGPWHDQHCHAGPPTGLAARAMELALPDQRLTRLTINLTRPIPHAKLKAVAVVERKGRIVSLSNFSLIGSDGKVCATGSGLHMTPQEPENYPSFSKTIGNPETAIPGPFPIQETLHGLPAFNGSGVETRYPPHQDSGVGPTTAWLRTVPLIDGEFASPFQRMCPLADCGNAFGRNAEPTEVNFMNPDLTVLLNRDPEGDWLGTQAVGYWENNGIGMADALLFDSDGVVGRALQTLLLRRS